MIYNPSMVAVAVFSLFVGITLALSFYLGSKAKSSEGYFAAHGQIPWFVNGVAFAGDYLSAASFLGICGMIAFHGYDGFLVLDRLPGRLDCGTVCRCRADEATGKIHVCRRTEFSFRFSRHQARSGREYAWL